MAKIGIDARLWTKTGVGRYIRNLVFTLAKNPQSQNHSFIIFVLSEDIKRISGLPKNFEIVAADFHWHSIAEQIGFVKLLNKKNLDLVHFTYSPAPLFYKKPYIITVHDLIMIQTKTGKASTLPYPVYAIKHEVYRFLLTKSIHNSIKIIVPTKTIKDEILRTFLINENKIEITYEGFDENITKHSGGKLPIPLKKKNYFLYVGNAYPHKNVETLIRAFDIFKKSNEHFYLVMVGEKDYFYERLFSTFGNQKHLIHLSHVDDSLLSILYSNAAAFISASKNEGFGLPIIESLSCRTPVILSEIPVFREIALDTALYFDPMNENALAKQMEFIVKHSDTLHQKAVVFEKDLKKRFSWSDLAQKTIAIYESCTGL